MMNWMGWDGMGWDGMGCMGEGIRFCLVGRGGFLYCYFLSGRMDVGLID